MFGWEFPPFISGGLGTACFGLTQALTKHGIEILFVLPRISSGDRKSHVRLISASEVPLAAPAGVGEMDFGGGIEFRSISSILRPYLQEAQYKSIVEEMKTQPTGRGQGATATAEMIELSGGYGPDLAAETMRYGAIAGRIAHLEKFDVIHAHDWMTVFAAVRSSEVSGKPLVLHVHALEFDRSGESINREIYDIERYGMQRADRVIAVSHYTKQRIVERYGVIPEKISVVHNAVTHPGVRSPIPLKEPGRKIVLFLGRITFQKGPDYFIEAAARVIEKCPGVIFVMAGAGDMRPRLIERAAELGIGKHFHFVGFLTGSQVEDIYAMSDLYVMPSVSEPFGITPLEAMLYDVPVIISKQSGVSEIIRNAIKVDFWDVDDLACKIISVLNPSGPFGRACGKIARGDTQDQLGQCGPEGHRYL